MVLSTLLIPFNRPLNANYIREARATEMSKRSHACLLLFIKRSFLHILINNRNKWKKGA